MFVKQDREPGLSFLLRCRNEEDYLTASLESLQGIRVPHEIIIFLHLCTDKSKTIAKRFKKAGLPIRIYEYSQEVSRPGFETLVTPANHPASIMTYYNFCAHKAKYNWIMKWDADFTATNILIRRLNALKLDYQDPTQVLMGVALSEDVTNTEPYLYNGLTGYAKHIFWEVPTFKAGVQEVGSEEVLIKSIPPTVLKKYWQHKPWFLREGSYDKDVADKYRRLVDMFGPEPVGLARASNPACDEIFRKVASRKDELQKHDIHFFD